MLSHLCASMCESLKYRASCDLDLLGALSAKSKILSDKAAAYCSLHKHELHKSHKHVITRQLRQVRKLPVFQPPIANLNCNRSASSSNVHSNFAIPISFTLGATKRASLPLPSFQQVTAALQLQQPQEPQQGRPKEPKQAVAALETVYLLPDFARLSQHQQHRRQQRAKEPNQVTAVAAAVEACPLPPPSAHPSQQKQQERQQQQQQQHQQHQQQQPQRQQPQSVEMLVGEPRQCAQCFVEDSPEWRRGPLGRKSLCNACGLAFAKNSHALEDAARQEAGTP